MYTTITYYMLNDIIIQWRSVHVLLLPQGGLLNNISASRTRAPNGGALYQKRPDTGPCTALLFSFHLSYYV